MKSDALSNKNEKCQPNCDIRHDLRAAYHNLIAESVGHHQGKKQVIGALEAARERTSDFSDGVFFVPLAPLTSAEFLVSAIAASLKFAFYGPDDPKEQLLNYLHEKEALLVLDNIEHLLKGVGLLTEILGYASHLKLMVTSRERLNLQGEWLVEVGGMDFPSEGADEGIEGYDAIQLFLQSARRVRPDFTLGDVQKPFVVRICQLMLGTPLGIELSATWLRTLSTEQIVREIEGGLEFLRSSLRDVPERHRSLWAASSEAWPTSGGISVRSSACTSGLGLPEKRLPTMRILLSVLDFRR